jgi:HEAT repeat protein
MEAINKRTIKKLNLNDVEQAFTPLAALHVAEFLTAPKAVADKRDSTLRLYASELLARGEDGVAALRRLVEYPDPAVRLWAASFLIRAEPERALATLAALADTPNGIVRTHAATVVSMWNLEQYGIYPE